MFNLFKRKKKTPEANPIQDKVVTGIVGKVIAFQVRWASFMQRKSENFSFKSRKIITVLFVFAASVYSLFIIASSIIHKPGKAYSISKIRIPAYSTETGDKNRFSKNLVPEKEYNKIIRFCSYMDSLRQTAAGQKVADSILLKRPGLMDSAIELKKLYELQKK